MITPLTPELLQTYRAQTYHTLPQLRLKNPQQAIEFINERGLAYLWPIKDTEFPSLWAAAAGNRPVADDHDDPGHITWGWKDSLLDQKVWYYARLLKRRNTFVSLELAPYLYALSPNYGSPEDDFAEQYQMGTLTQETKLVFEALLEKGPLDTLALRKAAHLSGKASNTAFNHALDTLQMDMRVLPVAISEAGRWHYAFVYDLTHRYFPELLEQARAIGESEARQKLLLTYFRSVGAATARMVQSIFRWSPEITARALHRLVDNGTLMADLSFADQKESFFAIPDLLR
ncbi:MAG: winged helix DNA-binding domain-containing protein [Anaerolineaceae bacterium]|nr:winged helix DNA-binding domain-containing protein [Anaerolineaceae bacterium]